MHITSVCTCNATVFCIGQGMAYNTHALYALCRGEAVEDSPAKMAARVVIRPQDQLCRLDHSKHPSLILAPHKVFVSF